MTDNGQIEVKNETGVDAVESVENVNEPVEKTEGTETPEVKSELMIKFTVEVPKEKVEQEFDETLHKYVNELKLPGFRKGKIPADVIKNRYKEYIQEEVLDKVLQKAVFDKVETDKIKIASRPKVDNVNYEEGKDLTAEVEVEVFPEIEAPELESLEVEIPTAELKMEEFDEAKQIDAILEGNKRQSPVMSRGIQDDDYVSIKYQTKILDTKRMTPQKQLGYHVKEDEKFEIADLYKDIIGKNREETFTITRSYPVDSPKKQWAGKEVEHIITILSVFEMVKPEMNEAFFKGMGVEDEATFKARLKEEYDRYNQQSIEEKKMKYIMDKLVASVNFPVPAAVVEEEAQHIASHYQERFGFNFDINQFATMAPLKAEAERTVRISLLVDAVKKKYEVEVSNDELENEYKNIAERNHVPLKDVRKYYMNKEQSQQLKEAILRDKVNKLLKEKVKVVEI